MVSEKGNSIMSLSEPDFTKAPLFPSCRLTLGLMTCLALTVLGMLRSNLTISLVCMVRKTMTINQTICYNNETESNAWNTSTCATILGQTVKGEFLWSRQYQGFLLSAYFYGYLTMQLLGGVLAGKFGAKHVLGTSVLIASAATLLTPTVARFNAYLLIFLRAVVGAGTGFIYPSVQSLWGIWAPPLERSLLSSFSFNGLNVGYMLAFLSSSMLCQVPFDNGWPLSFYATGFASLVFWIFWNLFVFSSPDQHPRIGERELAYIKHTTGLKQANQRKPFPWRKALTSPSVLALLVVMTSHTWFSYTQSTSVSLYFKDVLRLDIKQNGLFMILPYFMVLVTSPFLGYMADFVRRKKFLSTTAVRKLFQSISSFGSGALLIVISFLDYDARYTAVSILIILNVVNNVGRYGFLVNPQDIAPRYSGEIFGIVNTVATLSGILAPIVIGQMTSNGTQHEWRVIFYISTAVFVTGGLVFAIFAKGEPLPWTKEEKENETTMTEVVVNDNDINEKF